MASVQLIAAGVALFSAQRAIVRHYRYDQTDRSGPTTSFAQVFAAVTGTFLVGGSASPLWFAVGVAATYTATLVVGRLGWVMAGGLVGGAAASAAYNQQWTNGLATTSAVVIGIPLAFLILRGVAQQLYIDSEENMFARDLLAARVADLTQPLELAAEGDLSVAGELATLAQKGHTEVDPLVTLASAFDRTLSSLQLLVGQISVGGEQIGAAASQVLVAAREQAAAASEQSSAVAETSATIEELAATAAQIAETAEQVASFASETLGFAEQGRFCGGGVGGGDGSDCGSGGSDCVSGVGVGGEGSGDWSDFAGD